jgi:hypothetical protein
VCGGVGWGVGGLKWEQISVFTDLLVRVPSVLSLGCRLPCRASLYAVFEETDESAASSYFGEIIASVSDIQFTRDGRYIISRDYMSIKVDTA